MANRNTQEVFNAVIKAGFYRDHFGNGVPHMCISLDKAMMAKKINRYEKHNAMKVIQRYMRALGFDAGHTLRGALDANCMKSGFHTRKKIYKDWANRPFPK